jgi:hypothetical protein
MNNGGAISQRQLRGNVGELDQGGVNDACEIHCEFRERRGRPTAEHDVEHDFQLRKDLRKYGPPDYERIWRNPPPQPPTFSWKKPLAIASIILGTVAVVVVGVFIYKKISEEDEG